MKNNFSNLSVKLSTFLLEFKELYHYNFYDDVNVHARFRLYIKEKDSCLLLEMPPF